MPQMLRGSFLGLVTFRCATGPQNKEIADISPPWGVAFSRVGVATRPGEAVLLMLLA